MCIRDSNNHGYYFEIGEPSFLRTLARVNPDFSYRVMTVLRKDSLDMTSLDRELIKKSVSAANEERIVITLSLIHISEPTRPY